MDAAGKLPAESVVLRPSSRQRVASAASRAAFAAPLLFGAVFGGGMIAVAIVATMGAVAAIFAIDYRARRDEQIELAVDALVVDGTTYPWWAIDSIEERSRLGQRWVELAAFGLAPVRLPAPRAGTFAANDEFDREVAVVREVWARLRAEAAIPRIVDLRVDPVPADDAGPAGPAGQAGHGLGHLGGPDPDAPDGHFRDGSRS